MNKDRKQIIKNLIELREFVWRRDIPHSMIPEYVELHEKMQEIMGRIDSMIEEIRSN